MPEIIRPKEEEKKGGAGALIGLLALLAGGGLLAYYFATRDKNGDTCPAGQSLNPHTGLCEPSGYGPDPFNPYNPKPPAPPGYHYTCRKPDGTACSSTNRDATCYCGLESGGGQDGYQDQCLYDAQCAPIKLGTIEVCEGGQCVEKPAVGTFDAGYSECFGADQNCSQPAWTPGYIQIENFDPTLSAIPGVVIQGGSFWNAGWVCEFPAKWLPKFQKTIKIRVMDKFRNIITPANSPVKSVGVSITLSNNKWFGIASPNVIVNGKKLVMCGDVFLRTDANGEIKLDMTGLRDPGIGSQAEVLINLEIINIELQDGSLIQAPAPHIQAAFQFIVTGDQLISKATDVAQGCRAGWIMGDTCNP